MPILLVLVFNTIIFIIVIAVLVRHAIRRSNRQQKKFDIIQMMTDITGVVFLFGLTWIFGAFTILKADQTFQLIFTVTNSFQGFFIFILFCVLNSDVRLVWVKKLQGKRLASLKYVTSSISTKLGTLIRGMQPSENKCEVEHDETKMRDITEEIDTLSQSDQPSNTSPSSHINIQLAGETIINCHTSDKQSESEL